MLVWLNRRLTEMNKHRRERRRPNTNIPIATGRIIASEWAKNLLKKWLMSYEMQKIIDLKII